MLVRRIVYSRDALRTLRRMPANTATRIRSKIGQYAKAPESLANNVKPLLGEAGYLRLRVGDWRIILSEEGQVLAIIRIAPRGDAYP